MQPQGEVQPGAQAIPGCTVRLWCAAAPPACTNAACWHKPLRTCLPEVSCSSSLPLSPLLLLLLLKLLVLRRASLSLLVLRLSLPTMQLRALSVAVLPAAMLSRPPLTVELPCCTNDDVSAVLVTERSVLLSQLVVLLVPCELLLPLAEWLLTTGLQSLGS